VDRLHAAIVPLRRPGRAARGLPPAASAASAASVSRCKCAAVLIPLWGWAHHRGSRVMIRCIACARCRWQTLGGSTGSARDDCCVEAVHRTVGNVFVSAVRAAEVSARSLRSAAFQAGRAIERAARKGGISCAMRSEYVTGIILRAGHRFIWRRCLRRMTTGRGFSSGCASHRAWQGTYGGDPTVVGATFDRGHPFR